MTTDETVRRQTVLEWGVYPFIREHLDTIDGMFAACIDRAVSEKIVEKGDIVVITAGIPISTVGSTNLIKAQVID